MEDNKYIIKLFSCLVIIFILLFIIFNNNLEIHDILLTSWITLWTIQYGYNAITNTGGRKDMFKYSKIINHILRILVFIVALLFFIINLYFILCSKLQYC